jgi:hypothetical protein
MGSSGVDPVLKSWWQFVATIGAAGRLVKPCLETIVPKDMFAFWQPSRCLPYTLGELYAIFVVANGAFSILLRQVFDFDA